MTMKRTPTGDMIGVVLIDPITGQAYAAGSGGSSAAFSTVTSYFTVITAFAEADAGDTLRHIEVIDTATGNTETSIWSNVTQGTTLTAEPDAGDITQLSSNPVTEAQLEAQLKSVGVVASDGKMFNPASYAQTLSYNGDGTLNYVSIVVAGNTYRKSLTWLDSVVTGVSNWVKQ